MDNEVMDVAENVEEVLSKEPVRAGDSFISLTKQYLPPPPPPFH